MNFGQFALLPTIQTPYLNYAKIPISRMKSNSPIRRVCWCMLTKAFLLFDYLALQLKPHRKG